MANLNNELESLKNQLKAAGVSVDDFSRRQQQAGDNQEKLNRLIGEMQNTLSDVAGSAGNIYDRLQSITQEMVKGNRKLSLAKGAYSALTVLAQKLADDEAGITDLSKQQVQKLLEQAKIKKKLASDSLKDMDIASATTEEAKALLKAHEDNHKEAQQVIDLASSRLEQEKRISKQMGVTGAVIGGTGALMERLGMRSGIFKDAVEDAQNAMRNSAKQADILGEKVSKIEVAFKGLSKLAKGFGEALFDPATIGLKLLDTFFKINQQSVEISRLTGQSASNFDTFFNGAASARDQMEVVAELTKQVGLNAQNAFSEKNLQGAANLKVEMGLAAGEAGNLAIMAQTSNQEVEALTDSIVATTSEFNGANRTAISQGTILRDIGNVSEGIRASFAGNTKELVKGAAAARRLGMDIKDLDNIASSLMDFESSIQNELEAQLLTGKNINLAKARELALSNDLEGLGKELLKNSSDINEFGKMNRIQQEAQAKALGMTRDQLARVAYQRALDLEMTEDQAAAAADVNAEDMKRITAQENFAKALEKIAAALAPILDFVGNILSIPWVPQIILGAVAAGKLASNLSGIAGKFGGIVKNSKEFIKTITSSDSKGFFNSIKEMLGGKWEKIKEAFNQGTGKDQEIADEAKDIVKEKVTDSLETASDKTKNVKPGKNIKTFLKNLAEGLKEMASMKVLYGALNLIPASLGLVAMIPGVAGAKLMELISGPKLLLSMQSLGQGLTAMGTGKVLLGTLGLLATSAAFIAMIPASAGMALMGLTAPMAAAGIFALIPALTALGTAMVSGVGALGLAALIGMAVGIGAGFALIGAGALMMGKGIQFAAQGFVSIFGQLGTLVTMLPQLYLLGGALMSIAAGLGAIALTGIAAIPALAALSGFALMATPLIALGGLFGDGGEDSDGFAKLEAKLDTLIEVISSGGDVYLDSDKVGRTQAKSFSRLTGS